MSLSFTSLAFDQAEYAPGQTITLTVGYDSTDVASGSSVVSAVTVSLSDTASGAVTDSGNFTTTVPGTGAQQTSVSAADDRATPGTWTLVSNTLTGDAAPFSGVAVLSSTA